MSLADGAAASEWTSKLFARARASHGPRAAEDRSFWRSDEDDLARFRAVTHYETLLRNALEASGAAVPEAPLILVFGAGTGVNGVAPCLRLFRGARIVASDRTDADFTVLRHGLRQSGALDRVAFLEMEPESEGAPAATFDLVVGASILHRLLDPDRALANALRVLKPQGHAIFMEPFDGYGLLRLAFERICAEAELRGETLTPQLRGALTATIAEIAARTMPDPNRPGFAEMEHKWLFSRESLSDGARQIGFSRIDFFSHHDHPTLYREFAEARLRDMVGPGGLEFPPWAWAVLEDFDRALPPPVKRLLMLEGTILLTK